MMPAKRKAAPLGRNGTAHDRGETGTYSHMPEKASGGGRKFVWLDQVALDPLVSATAFRIGYLLRCMYGDAKTGSTFVGLDRLAADLGINEKTVRRGIVELVDRGHVRSRRRGKGHSNLYSPIIHDRTKTSDHQAEEIGSCSDNSVPMIGHSQGQKCPGNPPEPAFDPEAGLQPAGRQRSTAKGSRSAPGGASLPLVDYFCGQIVTHYEHGECEVVVVERDRLKIRKINTVEEYTVARGPTGEMTDAPF